MNIDIGSLFTIGCSSLVAKGSCICAIDNDLFAMIIS